MRTLWVVGVVAACSKSPPPDPNALPAADLPKLEAALANASATITARKESLAKTFGNTDTKIKASSQSATTKTPCPRTYKLPDDAALAAFVREGKPPIGLTYEITDKPPKGAYLDAFDKVRAEIAEGVSKKKAQKGDLERLQAAEALVVDDLIVDGYMTSPLPMGTMFEPGRAGGTAYLFSYTENRIICAGELRAKSSETLDYEFKHNNENMGEKMVEAQIATMKRDLEVNTAKALVASLYATWINDTPPP